MELSRRRKKPTSESDLHLVGYHQLSKHPRCQDLAPQLRKLNNANDRVHTEPSLLEQLDGSDKYQSQYTLEPLENLKANSIAKQYHLADSPDIIFRICKLLDQKEPLALKEQRASLGAARTSYDQQVGNKLNYRHKMAMRTTSQQLIRDLSKQLASLETMNLPQKELIEHKQHLLTAYFDVVVSDCQQECNQRGLLLKTIWQSTIQLLSSMMVLLSKHIRKSQSENLTESKITHEQYQRILEQYQQESIQLRELAANKQSFIHNLVYNLRYKRKELRKLYLGLKLLTERTEQYRKTLVELEIEHVDLQMHVKDITRETAELLVSRRMKLIKERANMRHLPTRKALATMLKKEMEKSCQQTNRTAGQMENNYYSLRPEKGERFIIDDAKLDQHRIQFRKNFNVIDKPFDLDDYGFIDEGTNTDDTLNKKNCSSSTQVVHCEQLLDGILKDRWVQTPFRLRQVEMYDEAVDTFQLHTNLGLSGRILAIKVAPTPTLVVPQGTKATTGPPKQSNRYRVGRLTGIAHNQTNVSKSRFSSMAAEQNLQAQPYHSENGYDNITTTSSVAATIEDIEQFFESHPQPGDQLKGLASHKERMETKASDTLQQISEDQQYSQMSSRSIHQSPKNSSSKKPVRKQPLTFHEKSSKTRKTIKVFRSSEKKNRASQITRDTPQKQPQTRQEFIRSRPSETINLPSKEVKVKNITRPKKCSYNEVLVAVREAVTSSGGSAGPKSNGNSSLFFSKRLYSLYYGAYEQSKNNNSATLIELLYDRCSQGLSQFCDLLREMRSCQPRTFEILKLLLQGKEGGTNNSLASHIQANIYLRLLFQLNCNSEFVLAHAYTTLEKVQSALVQILTPSLSVKLASALTEELLSIINFNRQVQKDSNSSAGPVRLNLDKTIIHLLARIFEEKQKYYDDMVPFACHHHPVLPEGQQFSLAPQFLELMNCWYSPEVPSRTSSISDLLQLTSAAQPVTLQSYCNKAIRCEFPLLMKTARALPSTVSAQLVEALATTQPDIDSERIVRWLADACDKLPDPYYQRVMQMVNWWYYQHHRTLSG